MAEEDFLKKKNVKTVEDDGLKIERGYSEAEKLMKNFENMDAFQDAEKKEKLVAFSKLGNRFQYKLKTKVSQVFEDFLTVKKEQGKDKAFEQLKLQGSWTNNIYMFLKNQFEDDFEELVTIKGHRSKYTKKKKTKGKSTTSSKATKKSNEPPSRTSGGTRSGNNGEDSDEDEDDHNGDKKREKGNKGESDETSHEEEEDEDEQSEGSFITENLAYGQGEAKIYTRIPNPPRLLRGYIFDATDFFLQYPQDGYSWREDSNFRRNRLKNQKHVGMISVL